MNLFVWTDALATGNPYLDEEHRELVRRVNAVLEAIAAQQGPDTLGPCMQQLQDYVGEHFAREEHEMQQAGYAERAAHCAAHATLLRQLQEVQDGLASGRSGEPMDLYRFLTWWVKDHIREWDQPLAAALAAQASPAGS